VFFLRSPAVFSRDFKAVDFQWMREDIAAIQCDSFKDFPGIKVLFQFLLAFTAWWLCEKHIILKFKHHEIEIVQKQQGRKKQPLGCIR
jgi:hypothetical protein